MANPLSQEDLETLISETAVQPVSYSKKDAITVYRKPCGRILPEEIKNAMGRLDQTAYTPNNGEEYFALQCQKNGAADVYRIDNFHDSYDVIEKNVQYELFPSLPNLVLARKKGSVPMVRFSELGFLKETKVVIYSPWNSTQTKEGGKDAFLVLNQGTKDYYMVQEDGGLPVNYELTSTDAGIIG